MSFVDIHIDPETTPRGPINKTFCESYLSDRLSDWTAPGAARCPGRPSCSLEREAASRASGARGGRRAHGGGLPPPEPPAPKDFLIFDMFFGGRVEVVGAHFGSIWDPFGVHLGAEILFIGRDRNVTGGTWPGEIWGSKI